MTKAKPDCSGQQFGMLTVLGKGGKLPYKNTYRQLWRVQCQCGKIIEIPRGYFEHNRQISCGCKRSKGLVDNKRRPLDISGQRFGSLQAIALTGRKDSSGKPTRLLQCDCGSMCELSLSRLRQLEHSCIRINCGDRYLHSDKYLTYPPTPNPYPKVAGELLAKYLPLANLKYQQIDSAVEDERRDRLIRAAWIIAYRRSCGEDISELHERRIIHKHLRYCSIDVFWKRKVESCGGFLYDRSDKKRELGSTMTAITSDNYPVIETQGNNILPIKKLRFRRC